MSALVPQTPHNTKQRRKVSRCTSAWVSRRRHNSFFSFFLLPRRHLWYFSANGAAGWAQLDVHAGTPFHHGSIMSADCSIVGCFFRGRIRHSLESHGGMFDSVVRPRRVWTFPPPCVKRTRWRRVSPRRLANPPRKSGWFPADGPLLAESELICGRRLCAWLTPSVQSIIYGSQHICTECSL